MSQVRFEIGGGEIVGLTGESGAGKTTIGLAALRALPPNARVSGSVRFNGQRIAPVFQEPGAALHPMLRARRQVEEVVRARGAGDSAQALAEAGLTEARLADAYPHELSGGQRQRVLIAQALAADPQLIIADEPTAALDAFAEAEIIEIFLRLKRRGLAMLLITHSSRLLRRMADRVLTIEGGRIAPDA